MRTMALVVGALLALPHVPPARAQDVEASHESEPGPPNLVTIPLGSSSATIWPFTGADLSGQPSDPINLIFQGDADPRLVRQALVSVDGNRSAYGFPDAFPFNCTWSDAIGRHQAAYAEDEGWTGSAIQLQCGAYNSLRFHLRLFREGSRTLGNVHFEVLIPGTTDHEVLAWEFAEQFVKVDLVRSGALTAEPVETDAINPAPTYRAIRHQVFNGLPVPLRAVLGLPLANQVSPIPIPSNGKATILGLSQSLQADQADIRVEFVHLFNQVIPKPFCSAGPLDFLKVDGPLQLAHRVQTNPSGRYAASFTASGVLNVTPVNPLTGQSTGPSYQAIVSESHRSSVTDERTEARHVVQQTLATAPQQSFFQDLSAGQSDRFFQFVDCGEQPD